VTAARQNLDRISTAVPQGRRTMLQSDVNLASPLRVVVADRHQATRSGIRLAVERAGFAVVAECCDGAAATAAVVRERAALCLIDADLSGANEAIAAIASLPLAPKVVVLASSVDEQAFFAALDTGASGYLLKDVEPGRLADELRGVADGGIALGPALAAHLVGEFRRRSRRRASAPAGLTDREWQVLQLLAEGRTTKEIALRLRVSSTTVRRHISSAVKRLGAKGRRNAVEWTRGVQRSEQE
jgi:DNA-binding NarL/FixJ family response regulator